MYRYSFTCMSLLAVVVGQGVAVKRSMHYTSAHKGAPSVASWTNSYVVRSKGECALSCLLHAHCRRFAMENVLEGAEKAQCLFNPVTGPSTSASTGPRFSIYDGKRFKFFLSN